MIIGTAGHIDHGKTALIRKLTGVNTDRLKEEKERGITIDLGFAYWKRPNGRIVGFVDVPGHERLVHTMLAGASGIGFVLLVVAADDGIMPQTREHLAIVDLLGLSRGVVALNKCDLVNSERIAEVTAELSGALRGTSLEKAEIIPVSAMTGEGLDHLAACIDGAAATGDENNACHSRFRLAADRCFTLQGQGTAVTGTVLSGRVSTGDRVTVSPSGLHARVRSIHAQNEPVANGEAGQRCALVLTGPRIEKGAIKRGDVVLDPVLHEPALRIDARLKVLPSETKPIGQWFPVKVHHAAAQVPGRVVVLGGPAIAPGESGLVQIVLERPLAACARDRFVLRDTTSSRTIGGGRFIDLRAPSRRRRTPDRIARIEALAKEDPATALHEAFARHPVWIDFKAFTRDRAIGEAEAASIGSELELISLQTDQCSAAMPGHLWEDFRAKILESLDAFHAAHPDLPGMGLEALRRAVDSTVPASVFLAAIRKLAEAGEAALDRMWVRRPHHSVMFTPKEEALLAHILEYLSAEPYRPPRVRDIARAEGIDEIGVRRLLRLAAKRGVTEEMAHDHFFTREAVRATVETAIALSRESKDGTFTAAEFRDRLGNGRKVAIQILEFFDRHGLTMRRRDLRKINPARIHLFAPAPGSGADARG
jgi:selenocysteine-specific elongation factor